MRLQNKYLSIVVLAITIANVMGGEALLVKGTCPCNCVEDFEEADKACTALRRMDSTLGCKTVACTIKKPVPLSGYLYREGASCCAPTKTPSPTRSMQQNVSPSPRQSRTMLAPGSQKRSAQRPHVSKSFAPWSNAFASHSPRVTPSTVPSAVSSVMPSIMPPDPAIVSPSTISEDSFAAPTNSPTTDVTDESDNVQKGKQGSEKPWANAFATPSASRAPEMKIEARMGDSDKRGETMTTHLVNHEITPTPTPPATKAMPPVATVPVVFVAV